MSRYLDMFTFITPPTTNGATLGVKDPRGCRAHAVGTAAVEIALAGDIFLQPPDAGGNQATNDFRDGVRVQFFADGDDVLLLFGAAAAALTPDPASDSAATPANICECIKSGTAVTYILNSSVHKSVYARTRTLNDGTARLRYRIISSLPGAR